MSNYKLFRFRYWLALRLVQLASKIRPSPSSLIDAGSGKRVASDAWKEAEGIAPVPDDAISSEEAVRRVRDSGPSTEGTKRP